MVSLSSFPARYWLINYLDKVKLVYNGEGKESTDK